MLTFVLTSLAGLIPGLGLLILKKWKSAFLVIGFFTWFAWGFWSVDRSNLYVAEERAANWLWLIGALWIGQFLATVALANLQASLAFPDAADNPEFPSEPLEPLPFVGSSSDSAGQFLPSVIFQDEPVKYKYWRGRRLHPIDPEPEPPEPGYTLSQGQGGFLYHLLTGTLLTSDPSEIGALAFLTLATGLPGALTLWASVFLDKQIWGLALLFSPLLLFAVLLSISLFKSIYLFFVEWNKPNPR